LSFPASIFADLLEAYFLESVAITSVEIRSFLIARSAVTFKFSTASRAHEMTRAIAHLKSVLHINAPEGLTILVWDGSAQPTNHVLRAYLFALTNWWFNYTGKRGELLDVQSDVLSTSFQPDTGTLTVVDLQRNRAFYWKQDASRIPYYESCSPFRSLLHSWMRNRENYFVHGAAIGTPTGGILLVGKGGSGKSTTALSCLNSPLQIAGDDYCIVRKNANSGFEAHSLYCTAKLVEEKNLSAFPGLQPNVVNPVRTAGEKVAISLFEYKSSKLLDHFPIRAVFVPVITGKPDTSIVPCSAHAALIALAPSTLSQLPASGPVDLRFLAGLTRSLPCFHILLGTDIRRIPHAIAGFLQSDAAQQPDGETSLVGTR
jgi:hypothetical protein